jgi:adenylate cyclase
VRLDTPGDGGRLASAAKAKRTPRGPLAAGGALVLLLIAGTLVWRRPWEDREEPASVEAMALPLPDKPSIAVLAFANLSNNPEQEYFADGMAEDLITDLSKISGLFVIARNSSFFYKGLNVKVRQMAEELGVRYVLEGSVRRAGDPVRINTQLIDAITGGHLWAERYDRQLNDIFALQDAIAAHVGQALQLRLTEVDGKHDSKAPTTTSLEAYESVLRARKLLTRFERRAAAEGKGLLEHAIELDPSNVEAYSLLGLYYFDEWRLWGKNRGKNLSHALELAKAAVELDPPDPGPHVLLAQIYQFSREFDAANREADRALAVQPRDAVTLGNLGSMLRYAHRAEEAAEAVERAIRLDPFHPPNYLEWLGDAYLLLGRYDDCIRTTERGVALAPDFVALHAVAAECHAALGNEGKAREAGARILRANPRFTLKAFASYVPFTYTSDLELKVGLLHIAGIPE